MPELTTARILAFPAAARPTVYRAPCYCCLGRPGAVAVADARFCRRCDALIRAGGIAPAVDDHGYEPVTKAAARYVAGGWRLFDAAVSARSCPVVGR